jgi:TRAP-type C4-dicarboxylate transport system substrate-binding protein
MKKIVRLTESDLVRIVKRVINEQSQDAEKFFRKKYPTVIEMAEYADNKVGSTMNRGLSFLSDNNGFYIKTSSQSKINPLADDNQLMFSALKNGKTSITYNNDYGVDPTPIPFPRTFSEFKRWFDNIKMLG